MTTDTGQDGMRYPVKIVGRLANLAGAVATADFHPAEQHRAVRHAWKDALARHRAVFDE